MAPKRSRTVDSSNTIPTSDSSRGTAAKPRLVDRDAEEEYARLLTKPILKERWFFPSGRDGELLPMIAEKGWITFCESSEAVPMSVVREFCANAKADKNGYSCCSWAYCWLSARGDSPCYWASIKEAPRGELKWEDPWGFWLRFDYCYSLPAGHGVEV